MADRVKRLNSETGKFEWSERSLAELIEKARVNFIDFDDRGWNALLDVAAAADRVRRWSGLAATSPNRIGDERTLQDALDALHRVLNGD